MRGTHKLVSVCFYCYFLVQNHCGKTLALVSRFMNNAGNPIAFNKNFGSRGYGSLPVSNITRQ